jgi:hypothetical protein
MPIPDPVPCPGGLEDKNGERRSSDEMFFGEDLQIW